MGSSHNVYIGAYLNITKTPIKEKEEEKTINSCKNSECALFDKNTSGSYCNECGCHLKNEKIIIKVNQIFNIHQLMYDFGDECIFYNPDRYKNILIPNKKVIGIYIDSYGGDENEYSLISKEESINKLESNFKDFLEFLSKNEVEYEIKYGAISYWA